VSLPTAGRSVVKISSTPNHYILPQPLDSVILKLYLGASKNFRL